MAYKGIWALIRLKGGLLLGFIVPISIISFGVDFFIHAIGRARETQVQGQSRERAYPIGLSAVALALVVAALTSAAAFASNAISGIETIVQFGIGAAIALLVAFAVLGLLVPKLLLAVEDAMGPAPRHHGPRRALLGAHITRARPIENPAQDPLVNRQYALSRMSRSLVSRLLHAPTCTNVPRRTSPQTGRCHAMVATPIRRLVLNQGELMGPEPVTGL